jgi:hypothetical protein
MQKQNFYKLLDSKKIMNKKLKITTCVPKQEHELDAKLSYIINTIKKEGSDIFITPQEYVGGWMMPQKMHFTKNEIIPIIQQISKETSCAIIFSGVIDRKQRIYFIDDGIVKGYIEKFACPEYAIKWYGIRSSTDMSARCRLFELKGIKVSAFFCWEIFSDILMAKLGARQPDLVANPIKFGIAGYPSLNKDGSIKSIQYCSGNIWKERLYFAAKFELKCPIACSTNTWEKGKKYMPLLGIEYPYDKLSTFVADITGAVHTQELDFLHIRGLRQHKFTYLKECGKFPEYKYNEYTMLFKMARIEQKLLKK